MQTLKIEMEIPRPTAWEISALARLTAELPVAPDGLFDGYTPEKAVAVNRLLRWGAITFTFPGKEGVFYTITEFGKAMLDRCQKETSN